MRKIQPEIKHRRTQKCTKKHEDNLKQKYAKMQKKNKKFSEKKLGKRATINKAITDISATKNFILQFSIAFGLLANRKYKGICRHRQIKRIDESARINIGET
jgi:hypothetical protein